jgi:hypothetical protein
MDALNEVMTESASLFKIMILSRPDPYFVEAIYESCSIELMPGVIGPDIFTVVRDEGRGYFMRSLRFTARGS